MKRLALCLLLLTSFACGEREGWSGRGVVRDVLADEAQVVIEHEDIEGLMPAMTMNFDVADPALLERLAPGQEIEFELRKEGRAYRVVSATVVAAGRAGSSGTLDDLAGERDVAPDFALTDQDGEAVTLAALRGNAVVLGFVYTRCPGPCPILTGLHRDFQQRIPEALRADTRIVSISLDPVYDTPEVLREYASTRGADLAGWSFLTGPPDTVAKVVRSYGVGTLRGEDGGIEHTVVTFLIDPEGRIAERWMGLEHDPDAMVLALSEVL